MATILNIETAAEICSVCISENETPICTKESLEPRLHASSTTILIDQALSECGLTSRQLDAVAVSAGPGSYTGLRIGSSIAKGLCYSLEIPLIAVSTLEAMAHGVAKRIGNSEPHLVCVMIDARRMEVFHAIYQFPEISVIREPAPLIIEAESFFSFLKTGKVIFSGSGIKKFMEICKHKHAYFFHDQISSSENLCSITNRKYLNKEFSTISDFTPIYLKPFQSALPSQSQ